MGADNPNDIAWVPGGIAAASVNPGSTAVVLDTSLTLSPLYRIDVITLVLEFDITSVIASAEVRAYVPDANFTIGSVSQAVSYSEEGIQPNRVYWESVNVLYPGPTQFTVSCESNSGLGSDVATCVIFYSTATPAFFTFP